MSTNYPPPPHLHRTHHISAWLVALAGLAAVLASVVVVTFATVALARGSAQGAQAGAAGDTLIAFTRADGLYVMRPDGSGVRRIARVDPTANPGTLGVSWSPDGGKLVLSAWDGIWVMTANGRDRVRLATAGEITNFGSPTWSPDGRRIAFTAYQGDDRDIWVMNADGSNQRRLKRTPRLFEGEVDWSPAGGWLVLDSGSWVSDVYVMRTDGSELRNLTPGGGWVGSGQPGWSPDGHRVAFGRASEIWVMEANGRSQVQLTTKTGDSVPDWSSDGRKIAFVRGDVLGDASEIYVMNADGTGVTRLTNNHVAEWSPAWRPVAAPQA